MASRFRLGLDTYSYHYAAPFWEPIPARPWTLESYIDRAGELDVEVLALADARHFTSTDDDTISALKARADEKGVSIELGTGGTDPEHIRLMLRLSAAFGSKVLRSFVSIGATWGDAGRFPADARRVAQALRDLVPACEETGVALAIENHQDLSSSELLQILDDVNHPLVGVCLDTGNSLGVLEDPQTAAKALASRTLTVHLKSYALLPGLDGYVLVGVPFSHNQRLTRAILAELSKASPMETLSINVESAVECIPVNAKRTGWNDTKRDAARAILENQKDDSSGACVGQRERFEAWIPSDSMPIEERRAMEDRLVCRCITEARELIEEFGS